MTLTALSAWLLTYWLHSTVLLAAAAVVTRWLVRSEAWRETLWKAALLGGLVTATVQSWSDAEPVTGRWNLVSAAPVEASGARATPLRPEGPLPTPLEGKLKVQPPAKPALEPGQTTPDRPAADSSSARPDIPWLVLLLGGWAAGATVLMVRLIGRHRRLGHLLADRRPVLEPGPLAVLAELRGRARMWRPVRLSASPRCTTPLAIGVSEICLPERLFADLGPDEQRGALAHELAHLARNDPAWQLAGAVLESVFFFQPLNRRARRRLRDAAEHLCDDWAVRQTGSPLGLARCLAEVATRLGRHPEPVPEATMAMAEHGATLLRRVERLLTGGGRERRPGGAARAVVVGGVLTAVGVVAPVVGTGGRIDDPRPPTATRPEGTWSETWSDSAGDARLAVDRETDDSSSSSSASRTTGQQSRIVRHPDPSQALETRWAWAVAQAREAGGGDAWIVWSHASLVPPGRIHVTDTEGWSDRRLQGRPRLAEFLDPSDPPGDYVVLLGVSVRGETAALRRIAGRTADLGFSFGARPVYWLGPATDAESFRFLTALFRRSDHAAHRETLVDLIAVHRPSDAVVPFLRDVLASDDTDVVRAEAAEGFEWHPVPPSVTILRDAALHDRSTHVRAEAAEALGELPLDDARDALVEIIRANPSGGVGEEAVESLAGHANERTLALLTDLVFGPHPPGIQREAVETIGDLEVAGVAATLERVARTHPDVDVRGEALDALGDRDDEVRIRVLSDVIREGGPERIRRDAVDALGDRGDPATLETLLRVAMDDPSPSIQREAVEQLANFTPAAAAPVLRRIAFEAGQTSTRRQAAETLGDLPAEAALPVLDEIIASHPDVEVAKQAVESLGNYSARVSLDRLETILRSHPNVDVRREALDQMENLGAFRDGGRRQPPEA